VLRQLIPYRTTAFAIFYHDIASGRVTELHGKEGPFHHQWLAFSPDEQRDLYSENPFPTSELMLVENFR
jgi:hypothetical protein